MIQPKPDIELGEYEHYKGGKYEVYDLTCDEASGEWRVSYRPLYDVPDGTPDRWSRPVTVFVEEVSVNGMIRKRFEKAD